MYYILDILLFIFKLPYTLTSMLIMVVKGINMGIGANKDNIKNRNSLNETLKESINTWADNKKTMFDYIDFIDEQVGILKYIYCVIVWLFLFEKFI